jgi:hypothetical protein
MKTENQQRESLPLQSRLAPIGSVDAVSRTATLLWTTGGAVKRYDYLRDRNYIEELSMEPGHVRMDRLQSGKAPLLNNHGTYDLSDVLGVVEQAIGTEAVVRFSDRQDVEPIFQDVKNRILRNVSVGYAVYQREMIPPATTDDDWVYRVIDWEPFELSIVTVPADAGAEVRSAVGISQLRTFEVINLASGQQSPTMKSEDRMTQAQNQSNNKDQDATIVERQRVQEIREFVAMSHLGGKDQLIDSYITRGLDAAAVGKDILRRMAERSDGFMVRSAANFENDGNTGAHGNVNIKRMSDALFARLTGTRVSDEARQYAGYRMTDFARDILQANGVHTTNLSPNELIVRSIGPGYGTSDFPNLLLSTGERVLRMAYQSYQGGLRRIAKESSARDFRSKTSIMLGETPTLKKVSESGEFTRGSMAESAESYRIDTFGRIISISRHALVNDDLGAFGDLTRKLGMAASEFVASELVTLLTSNPTMSDGVRLFHATHKNLAGSGAPISDATLSAARLAMRTQTGLDGITIVDATPRYLIVPAALENTAMKYLASLRPTAVADVNPFAGTLELVVDPRLDAISATAWYLAADQSIIDTIEYAYLEGADGPMIESRLGFEVDGMEMKVRLDFGGGVLDYRGLYLNAGV